MLLFRNYIADLTKILETMSVTDQTGSPLDQEEGFTQWCVWTEALKKRDANAFFIGNGASATMSSHMAADASKNGGFRCQAFNDAALLTAVSNDIDYEQVFAFPLKRFGRQGDLLMAISSSGNSPNIVSGIETALEQDMKVITLSGMSPQNRIRHMGHLNFHVPGKTYGLVEVAHQAVLHCWLDLFMERELELVQKAPVNIADDTI